MSKAWAAGSSRRWRRIRAEVLARDGHRCRLRIPGRCTTRATTVHHTQGRAVTGDNPQHLIAACSPCNGHVGEPARHGDPPITGARWWE